MRAIKLVLLRAILALALGCFVWLSAIPAHADTLYDVTGTATMTGNDVCNGVCVETFNFNFQLDEVPFQYPNGAFAGYTLDIVPGSTVSGTGPLGAPYLGGGVGCDRECYVAVYFGTYSYRTEFDLGISNEHYENLFPAPLTPAFDPFGTLYTCGGGDQACVADFCLDQPFGCGPPAVDGGSVSTTVAATPEPATLGLLLCGLFVLGLTGIYSLHNSRPRRVPKRWMTPLA